jgi:hypothetical protein
MATKSWHLSRRTLLKGMGVALALPLLEAMRPVLALAAPASSLPNRMAFLYVPNGIHIPDWTPATTGADFQLPWILEPLQPFKDDVLVLTGLTCDKARPHGDGGGDHARAMSAFLTGSQPRKTSGADIKVGVSVDQVAAQKIGQQTRFPSLEIGCDRGLQSGNCDTGYSCAYSANLSWRAEATPMPKEVNPKLVFERLFAGPLKEEADAGRAKRDRYNKSILDFVSEDAGQLRRSLGVNDQRKLDEYLNSVREVETRIELASRGPEEPPPGAVKPEGIPKDYEQHIRLLCDLLALAFQGDLTRVSTFVFANEGSNRSYKFIGVPEGHHDLSHHGGDRTRQEKLKKINRFHVARFGYLLGRLKGSREGGGTLLDNCMVVYGSGISDGDRHDHDDLPILLAGKGGRTIRPGRHVRHPGGTPLTNLYLSMLDRVGVRMDSFGDSTGRLPSLEG